MSDPARALTLQLLEWISDRPRPYAELLEAWRSTCPRLSIWEDACTDGLIDCDERAGRIVALSPKGEAMLRAHQSSSSHRTLAGKCLCGAIHYAVADQFSYALNCHCSDCRKATGSAFKAFAGIERDKLRLTQRQEQVLISDDEKANHDVHCKVCGSMLYSVVSKGAFVHVTLGTLVDDPTIRPKAHIIVGDKAPWFKITDNLPQHEAHE